MPEVHCFTCATLAYLDRARVLAETLRRHHPDWTLTLCLCDREPPGFSIDWTREPFDEVVRLDDLGIPDLARWAFEHDVVELCTAVKGTMLCRLLETARLVVYLDPDIAVMGDLAPVVRALEHHDVVLTPHQLEPETSERGVQINEVGSLRYGIYNLGFLGVSRTTEGLRFARWWRDRLLAHCFDDPERGLFTDQRWCDHVPVFFPGTHVLRDPGCNVACWNLSRRPIEIGRDGLIRAGGHLLRFFHFTKMATDGPGAIEQFAGDGVGVFELVHWYRARLAAHAVDGLPDGWWAFGRYDDGTAAGSGL